MLAVVRATLPCCCGDSPDPLSTVTRRCLVAFARELIDDPGEQFPQLDALRVQCRVKTQAEYDREIGDLLRADPAGCVPCWMPELRVLVDASRLAPEGEP
jgi:hypothetical protein